MNSWSGEHRTNTNDREGGTKMNDKEKELEKIADQLLEKAAEMTSLANELYRLIGHVKSGNYEWTADGELKKKAGI